MSVRRLVLLPYTPPRLEQFGQVHSRTLKSDYGESKIDTVYLYNVRITCYADTVEEFDIVLPYVHLNSYDYRSKKGSQKQIILTQVTLFEKLALSPNTEFRILDVNGIPFNLEGKTDEAGRLTARYDLAPAVSKEYKSAKSPPLEMPRQAVKAAPIAEPLHSRCGCMIM
jgi:hypothetical protein